MSMFGADVTQVQGMQSSVTEGIPVDRSGGPSVFQGAVEVANAALSTADRLLPGVQAAEKREKANALEAKYKNFQAQSQKIQKALEKDPTKAKQSRLQLNKLRNDLIAQGLDAGRLDEIALVGLEVGETSKAVEKSPQEQYEEQRKDLVDKYKAMNFSPEEAEKAAERDFETQRLSVKVKQAEEKLPLVAQMTVNRVGALKEVALAQLDQALSDGHLDPQEQASLMVFADREWESQILGTASEDLGGVIPAKAMEMLDKERKKFQDFLQTYQTRYDQVKVIQDKYQLLDTGAGIRLAEELPFLHLVEKAGPTAGPILADLIAKGGNSVKGSWLFAKSQHLFPHIKTPDDFVKSLVSGAKSSYEGGPISASDAEVLGAGMATSSEVRDTILSSPNAATTVKEVAKANPLAVEQVISSTENTPEKLKVKVQGLYGMAARISSDFIREEIKIAGDIRREGSEAAGDSSIVTMWPEIPLGNNELRTKMESFYRTLSKDSKLLEEVAIDAGLDEASSPIEVMNKLLLRTTSFSLPREASKPATHEGDIPSVPGAIPTPNITVGEEFTNSKPAPKASAQDVMKWMADSPEFLDQYLALESVDDKVAFMERHGLDRDTVQALFREFFKPKSD